jgi:hypothetical protein
VPISCPRCGKQLPEKIGSHIKSCPLTLAELFWLKVDKSHPSGCWQWTASRKERGYGQFMHHGKMYRAHRLAWILTNGQPPADKELAHSCHNKLCVNPSHMRLASHAENMAESVAARRHAFGERGRAKLTDALVIQIRAEYRVLRQAGKRRFTNAADLASRYGVSDATVQSIADGRTWRHL